MVFNFLYLTYVGSGILSAWNSYLSYRQLRCSTHIDKPALQRAKRYLEVTDEEIQKSQTYSSDKLVFSMVQSAVSTIFEFGMISLRAYPWIWNIVQKRSGVITGGFAHGFLFSFATGVISYLMNIPWDLYSTFVIEERHGFNKQIAWTWFKDQIKGFFLNFALLQPITCALLYYVVDYFGKMFPVYLFGAATVFLVVMMYVYPAFIQPLFNKFTTLPKGELRTKVEDMCHSVNFPLKKIYEMDGSTRSSHSNAYFYGVYGNKHIVIFDTLLKQLQTEEIMGVLCHELGHWWHNHLTQHFTLMLVQLYAMCYSSKYGFFSFKMVEDFGFTKAMTCVPGKNMVNPILGFSIMSMCVLEPIFTLLSYALNSFTRYHEKQADEYAIKKNYGEPLKTGLIKLGKENKAQINPDWLYAACTYSHPPMISRVEMIEEKLAKLK